MSGTAIVWYRRDLRVEDNPALMYALANYDRVVPLYLQLDEAQHSWADGAATRCWLHHSLADLSNSLSVRGSRLILRQGTDALSCLHQCIEDSGAVAVYWNRLYEPHSIERDSAIKTALAAEGIAVDSFNGSLLFEPWQIAKQDNTPYRVFTPYWKACMVKGISGDVQTADDTFPAVADNIDSNTLAELDLLPALDWDKDFYNSISPGEDAAHDALQRFLEESVEDYVNGRDMPAIECTSRLSIPLHFGALSPQQVIAATQMMAESGGSAVRGAVESFQRQLGWREFAHHILYHFPHTTDAPMNRKYEHFRWRDDAAALAAWQQGRTGIPLVDAGMRELWHTGYMHNRVRMVVASLLTKNLLIPWQQGARWFWDTLLDADLANNSMGWQWAAGSGADAAPYFRIFNPVSQSEKFDSDATYITRWCPELGSLPVKYRHKPWLASPAVLDETGLYRENLYPEPIVDLAASRKLALERYQQIR